jgi:serine/threonine protein kinase/WD40 repeat protein/tetratricopeptide (TPR) repeat protein
LASTSVRFSDTWFGLDPTKLLAGDRSGDQGATLIAYHRDLFGSIGSNSRAKIEMEDPQDPQPQTKHAKLPDETIDVSGTGGRVEETSALPVETGDRSPTIAVDQLAAGEQASLNVPGDVQRYELTGELARGGMGIVMKGRDTALGRELAIKMLMDDQKDRPELVRRFIEEAQIAGQLQHPGIAPVYELGKFEGNNPFIAMKLVKGQTLGKMLRERQNLQDDRSRFIGIFEQICQTIAYAHKRRVIHRDLKPDNVMVGAFGETQVMDWGLAKVLDDGQQQIQKTAQPETPDRSVIQTLRSGDSTGASADGSATNMGSVMGTPAYMPPEQALGEIDMLDERADVFGLGAILCEILTADPPYRGANATAKFRQAARGNVAEAFERLDHCGADAELIELAKSCLAPDRDDRPRTAEHVANAVTEYLESVEERLRVAETARIAADTKAIEERKRRRLLLALAGSVLLLVASLSAATILVQRKDAHLARQKASLLEKQIAAAQVIQQQNVEITAANQNLKVARAEAIRQQQRAEESLADMQTTYGLISSDNGHIGQAALWFSRAAASSRAGTARQAANLIRTRNWIQLSPTPVQMFSLASEGGGLRQFTFQPSGHLLLMQGAREMHVWDWVSDREVDVDWGEVTAATWNPAGDQLITADVAGLVRRYSVADWQWEEISRLPHAVYDIKYSPDTRYLVIGTRGLQVWDTQAEQLLDVAWQQPSLPLSIDFAPDGRRFVVSSVDKKARVFSLAKRQGDRNGKTLFAPVEHTPVTGARALFGIHGSLLTADRSGNIVRRDGEVGARSAQPSLTTSPAYLLRTSHHDDLVLVGMKSDGFLCRDLGEGRHKVLPIDHNVSEITDAAFTADDQTMLTVAWDQTARLWRTQDGLQTAMVPHAGIVERCAITEDGGYFATAERDGLVRVFRNSPPLQPDQVVANFGLAARISPDGRFVTPGQWHQDPWGNLGPSALVPLDVASGGPLTRTSLSGRLVDSCVAAEQTLAAVVYTGSGGELLYGDLLAPELRFQRHLLSGRPCSIAARNGTAEVAVLSEPGRVDVFDLQSGELRFGLTLDDWQSSDRHWPRLQYSADGASIVIITGGLHNHVEVLDAQTGEPRFAAIRPVLKEGPCRAMALSPSGKLLATAVNGTNAIQVWSLETGQPLCEPLLHPGDIFGIYCVAFSPDEQLVVSGSKDRQLRIWNWREERIAGPTLEHQDEVWSVAVLPDGKHIVSGGRDGLLMLWDAASGKPLMPPLDCGDSIMNLSVVPNSSNVFITCSDRIIAATEPRLLKLDLAGWIAPPPQSLADMSRLAELVSSHTVQQNSARLIDAKQWQQKLSAHRADYPDLGLPTPADTSARGLAVARSAMGRKDWMVALAQLRRVLAAADEPASSLDADLRFHLQLDCLQVNLELGRLEEAAEWLAAAKADLPAANHVDETEGSRALLIRQYQQLLADDVALETVPIVARCLRDPEQYVPQLEILKRAEQWDLIVDVIHSTRKLLPNHDQPRRYRVYFELGYAFSRLGDEGQAIEAYQQALQLDDSRASAYNNLAYKLKNLERWEEAAEHLHRAAELEPESATRHRRLAEVLLEAGQFKAGVAHLKIAYRFDPNSIATTVSRAKSLRESRRYDDAAAIMKALLEVDPQRTDLHFTLSLTLSATSRLRASLHHAQRAVELHPDNDDYQHWLTSIQVKNKRFAEAERSARQTLATQPDLLSAHVNLGQALLGQNRFDESIDSLQQAATIAQQRSAFPELYLAVAHRRKGRYEQALAFAREARIKFGASVHAEEALREVAQLLVISDRQPAASEREVYQIANIVFADQPPEDDSQRIAAALWCYDLQQFQRAAELYTQALVNDQTLLEDHRYNAICCAVLACQQSDQESISQAIALPWFEQAILWMNQELDLRRAQLESKNPAQIRDARVSLKRWLIDEDLDVVRGIAADPRWHGPQHQELSQIWKTVEDVLSIYSR